MAQKSKADPLMFPKTKVGVYPAQKLTEHARLWQGLRELYSLEFIGLDEVPQSRACQAVFAFCAMRDEADAFSRTGVRSMAFIQTEACARAAENISTTSSGYLRSCLRERTLPDASIDSYSRLEPQLNDQIISRCGDYPLWIYNQSKQQDIVTTEPPRPLPNEYLYEHFQSSRWTALLPLLHFAQEVSGWTPPPIRAALIFDDPNLHWPSYGYIDYRRLAEDARESNYHVSFATIPLDSWYVHSETAKLFRANPKQLSLSIHGNNHTYYELTQASSDHDRLALASQALRRIEGFEANSHLRVSCVMAAPHGACNHLMADALRRTGFEAACISRSSMMIRNPGTDWPLTIGLTPGEFLGAGLPIYPRYNIRWDDSYPIFSAFLGQPVVAVGHHEDAAGELRLVRQTAETINSLGNVQWTDLQSIARSNFITKRAGDVLYLRMYSRKVSLTIPEGVEKISIDRVWEGAEHDLLSSHPGNEFQTNSTGPTLVVEPGKTVTISSNAADMVDRRSIRPSKTPLWAIARRQLCEGRDRLRPAVDRWRGRNGHTALAGNR